MSISCITSRRSVRKYTDEKVSDEQVEALVRAGMYAPSAMNSQPWEFIVVRDPDKLKALSGVCMYWKMLKNAPLAIVITANLKGYKASNTDFFVQDCSASAQNILLAAEENGLGGVWLGMYGKEDRMKGVADVLGIPGGIIPFVVLSIGHPAAHAEPHDEYKAEKVFYDTYGVTK